MKLGAFSFFGLVAGKLMVQKPAIRFQATTDKQFLELEEVMAGTKELPASINTFLNGLKNSSGEIHEGLSVEHNTQAINLNATFDHISTCTVDADDARSLELAASAKSTLCLCRKEQAVTNAEAQGCEQELSCHSTVVDTTEIEQNDFLQQMYTTQTGTSICTDSSGWRLGSDAPSDAVDWFAGQVDTWENHWNFKKNRLEALHEAHSQARSERDDLDSLCQQKRDAKQSKDQECIALQNHATLNQCHSISKSGCALYAQCRQTAEDAWDVVKERETRDSQDRKDAWVAAAKINCLAESFTEDDHGKLQISDASVCAAITCNTTCTDALDLSTSLERTPPVRTSCTSPPSPCAIGGWEPSCSSDETASWGSHMPTYFIGLRVAPACTQPPVALDLADRQVTDACQDCTGFDASTYTAYVPPTPEPTPVPTPAPTPAPPCASSNHITTTGADKGWNNNWDGDQTFDCPSGSVLTSIYSVHDNAKEDRRWKFDCAPLVGGSMGTCEWSNGWTAHDGSWTLGDDEKLITGIMSTHSNTKEDRKFRIRSCKVPEYEWKRSVTGNWKNGWDAELEVNVPAERFLTKIQSTHDDGAEDRRFKFGTVEFAPKSGHC